MLIDVIWQNIYVVVFVSLVTTIVYQLLLKREQWQYPDGKMTGDGKIVITKKRVVQQQQQQAPTLNASEKKHSSVTTDIPTSKSEIVKTAPVARENATTVHTKKNDHTVKLSTPSSTVVQKTAPVEKKTTSTVITDNNKHAVATEKKPPVEVTTKASQQPSVASNKVQKPSIPQLPTGLIGERLSSTATSNNGTLTSARTPLSVTSRKTTGSSAMSARRRPKTKIDISGTLEEADKALSQVQSVSLPDPNKELSADQPQQQKQESPKKSLEQVLSKTSARSGGVDQNAMKMASMMNVSALAAARSNLRKTHDD